MFFLLIAVILFALVIVFVSGGHNHRIFGKILPRPRYSFSTPLNISFKILVGILLLLSTGCGTLSMALKEDTEALDISNDSVALMIIKTTNVPKPQFVPYIDWLDIFSFQGEKRSALVLYDPEEAETSNEYLVSFSMPPGSYHLGSFHGEVRRWSTGHHFNVPLNIDFTLKGKEIVYLGRIELDVREKTGPDEVSFFERRVYPNGILHLIVDKIAKIDTYTYDLIIKDAFEEDISIFTKKFPLLNKYSITKDLLSGWTKPDISQIKSAMSE